jgi:DNA polymerase III alpha subunit
MKQFSSPHVHPQSLDSASTPEALAKREVELGSGSLTCTDHGSLACAYTTYELAKKNNLTPVIGLEAYVRDDNCPILTQFGIPKTDTVPKGTDKDKWKEEHPDGSFFDYNRYFHATLGFRDFKAYKVAVRLLSKADARAEQHGSERKAIWGWNEIEELAAHNVTLGSSCLVGLVSRHLLNTDVPQDTKVKIATAYFERLHHLFQDRFFVEVFPHRCTHNFIEAVFIEVEKEDGTKEVQKYYFGKSLKTDAGTFKAKELADSKNKHQYLLGICNYRVWTDFEKPLKILNITKQEGFVQNECAPWSPDGDLQFGSNIFMMHMAKKYGVPVQISDDAHYDVKERHIIQNVRLAQSGSLRFHESYYRMSSADAFSHFNKIHNISEKTFEGWIDNSKAWLEGFKGFTFDNTPQLPTKFFPADSLAYTKELIKKHGRFKNEPVYIERLKKEIDILHKNGKIDLLPYFFIDEEVCRIYQNQGGLTSPGRGSGGGLLLAYLMGITHLDPIKENLSLERFINQARIEGGSLPDVDQDLSSRDLLVGYDTNVVEVESEDGTKRILPEDFKIETDQGLLTVKQAVKKQAEFKAWW